MPRREAPGILTHLYGACTCRDTCQGQDPGTALSPLTILWLKLSVGLIAGMPQPGHRAGEDLLPIPQPTSLHLLLPGVPALHSQGGYSPMSLSKLLPTVPPNSISTQQPRPLVSHMGSSPGLSTCSMLLRAARGLFLDYMSYLRFSAS